MSIPKLKRQNTNAPLPNLVRQSHVICFKCTYFTKKKHLYCFIEKVALLFWFLGDFRCGTFLFMVSLAIYKYKNR